MIAEKAGFKTNHPWMKEVTSGNISIAYKMYKKSAFLNSLLVEFLPSFRFLANFLYKFLPVDHLISSSGDDSIDLAPELILFWSKPDYVGFRLIWKLLRARAVGLKPDLRSLFWYAHWLGFQGYHEESKVIFEKILQSKKLSGRLEGEFYSLYGNLYFSIRKIEKSIECHVKANDILEKYDDMFFVLYNLGVSAKSYVLVDSSSEFKKNILFKYDNLDPDKPDPRFGLRVLIYLAYLYSQEGERALASLYLESSNEIYLSSTSEIDKSIYCIYRALISFSEYEFNEAFQWLDTAQNHLNKFGQYKIYQDQINEIRNFFTGKAGIKPGILYHFKTSSYREVTSQLTSDWNETFVKYFYEITNVDNLKEFENLIVKLSVSNKTAISKISETKLDEGVVVNHDKSSFHFIIPAFDNFYKVNLESDIKRWRNEVIFENIHRTLILIREIYIKKYNDKLVVETEKERAVFDTNKQLAHDIRSPLAALDTGIKFLENTTVKESELIRSAINRIHDIANNLVGKNESLPQTASVDKVLLTSSITNIMSEKRTEYRGKPNIKMDFTLTVNNYGLFSNIIESDFQRILSNLINNSVEAIGKKSGMIKIRLKSDKNKNIIEIEDNGGGISAENLNTIFDKGFSSGKKDGTGIGLFHAKQTITDWGGEINCDSQEGVGATFSIELPSTTPPVEFVTELALCSEHDVVIVDDDLSIHELWKDRLVSFSNKKLSLSFFSSPKLFLDWLTKEKNSNQLFLIDYEFLGQDLNGVDLLKKIESNSAYLVTSHFDEDHIKNYCKENSVGVIDKGSLGFLPIEVEASSNRQVVLIDDDPIMHLGWEMEAKACDVELRCYKSVDEFMLEATSLSLDTVIFVDSNLGANIKGEIESEKIFKFGFQNIYLATGYRPEDIAKPSWIKSIVGKKADFSLLDR